LRIERFEAEVAALNRAAELNFLQCRAGREGARNHRRGRSELQFDRRSLNTSEIQFGMKFVKNGLRHAGNH
jgi:hypothetical protein